MHVLATNYVYDPALDAEALLERYDTLTGWGEALLAAGASRVTVAQRFSRDLETRRNGVDYLFRADRWGPRPRPWARPGPLHRAVAQARPDVVHCNGLIFPLQIWQLRRGLPTRIPLVVQDHAGTPPRPATGVAPLSTLRRLAWRMGLRAASAFLFSATAQAEPWRAAGLIAAGQPVHEVAESSRHMKRLPRPEAQARSGVTGAPALLWVGRLNVNKDPLTVLAGLERALPHQPQARLTMVYQDGELLGAVRDRLAASRELGARVRLQGAVPHEQLAAFYGAADLFVLGSHHEGSGYALLEALACGALPLVTDIPSFRALTAGGTLGALWPPGDAAALAAALVSLAARELGPLRDAAARHFEQALSWPAVGRRALAIYREVLGWPA